MGHAGVRTSPRRLAVTWIIVLVPLGWGIFQSVVQSLPLLLRSPDLAATAPAERSE